MLQVKQKRNCYVVGGLLLFIVTIAVAGLYRMQHDKVQRNHQNQNSYVISQNLQIDGVILKTPRPIAQFTFTDDQGKPFGNQQFRGHWTMLFFGFTNCGYVCPTTLSALGKMYQHLEGQLPNGLMPQVVLVSVDPARDTVARLHSYVKAFNAHFIGVRGNEAETQALADQLSVVYMKMQDKKSKNYTMNHSAEIMLVDPNGQLHAFFSFPHDAERMRHDYLSIIGSAH